MYHTENTNRKENMTIKEAFDRVLIAVEYYDMVHDTGEKKQNEKNKNYVWEGYETIAEFINKHKK